MLRLVRAHFPLITYEGESLIQTFNMGVATDVLTKNNKIKVKHFRFEYVIYSIMRYPPEKSTWI